MDVLNIIAFVFATISFFVLVAKGIKHLIYQSNNSLADKLIYTFTRAKQAYSFENQTITYIYYDDIEIGVNVNLKCISNVDGLTSCDMPFAWNGDREREPIVLDTLKNPNGDDIGNLNQTRERTTFNYPISTVSKGERFEMNYTIKNLTDKACRATYISSLIRKKTKILVLRVVLPKDKKLKKVTFKIEKNHMPVKFWAQQTKVESLEIKYVPSINGYQYVIKYPRMGYNYIMDWEI